jgi:hypothetical protein
MRGVSKVLRCVECNRVIRPGKGTMCDTCRAWLLKETRTRVEPADFCDECGKRDVMLIHLDRRLCQRCWEAYCRRTEV